MVSIAFYVMNSKGLYTLRSFIEKFGSSTICYVVCSKDKGLEYDAYEDIKNISINNNIEFYDRLQFDENSKADFTGVKFAIGWRWLIENKKNLIVFHDSLLPKYRGFSPLVNSLINKESQGGVTALFAEDRYDEGKIIDQKSISFSYPLKIEQAIQQIQPLYFELVRDTYIKLKNEKSLISSAQDHENASYSCWLDEQDYFIDWSWSAEKIKLFVDAVGFPYGCAKAILKEQIIIFREVAIMAEVLIEGRQRHLGKVIFNEDNVPVVVCCSGLLKLNRITDIHGNDISINFRSRFQ